MRMGFSERVHSLTFLSHAYVFSELKLLKMTQALLIIQNTKVYKHTGGNANPQKYTEPYFRVNIVLIVRINFVMFQLNAEHKKFDTKEL